MAAVGSRDSHWTSSSPAANATVAWPFDTSIPGVSTASFGSSATGSVNAPVSGAMRVSVVVTRQSTSNAIRRTTLTNGGNTVPPSASPPAAASRWRVSSSVPDGKRASTTPATSQPGAVTAIRRGGNGNGRLRLSTGGKGPRSSIRCTPSATRSQKTSAGSRNTKPAASPSIVTVVGRQPRGTLGIGTAASACSATSSATVSVLPAMVTVAAVNAAQVGRQGSGCVSRRFKSSSKACEGKPSAACARAWSGAPSASRLATSSSGARVVRDSRGGHFSSPPATANSSSIASATLAKRHSATPAGPSSTKRTVWSAVTGPPKDRCVVSSPSLATRARSARVRQADSVRCRRRCLFALPLP